MKKGLGQKSTESTGLITNHEALSQQSNTPHIVKTNQHEPIEQTIRKNRVKITKDILKLMKQVTHLQNEVTKYKKRYKDLKLQIEMAGPGNLILRPRRGRRGRPRKNEQSIYVSTDSDDDHGDMKEDQNESVDSKLRVNEHIENDSRAISNNRKRKREEDNDNDPNQPVAQKRKLEHRYF